MKIELDARKTIDGLDRLSKMGEWLAQSGGLRRAALVVEKNAKLKLTESGSHKKGTPTPSAPGEPPAIVTGALRRSVRSFPVTRNGFGSYQVKIGPTMVYARVQELGGGRSNLPARPYMDPAVKASEDEVRRVFTDYVKQQIAIYTRGS